MAFRRPAKRKGLNQEQATDPVAVEQAAVALLARRDFASGELRQKLLKQGFEHAAIEAVVGDLLARGLLDDVRFAEHFVGYHADRGQGPNRIREELRGLVAADLIEAALDARQDWAALAHRVRVGKFGAEVPAEWQEKARQARFLQYRGFSTDHIRLALGGDFDESTLANAPD